MSEFASRLLSKFEFPWIELKRLSLPVLIGLLLLALFSQSGRIRALDRSI